MKSHCFDLFRTTLASSVLLYLFLLSFAYYELWIFQISYDRWILLAHVTEKITESSCRPRERWQQPTMTSAARVVSYGMFWHGFDAQHGAVLWKGSRQDRASLKLIFERLRDRMEVRFSPLCFILSGLCENVLHEKLSRTPLRCAALQHNRKKTYWESPKLTEQKVWNKFKKHRWKVEGLHNREREVVDCMRKQNSDWTRVT